MRVLLLCYFMHFAQQNRLTADSFIVHSAKISVFEKKLLN